MKKLIQINKDQSIELNGSLGWLYVYREQFGHDILPDLMPLLESSLTTAVKIMQGASGIETRDIIEALDDQIMTDIFINLSGLEATTVLNIIWAMAKNADSQIEAPEAFFNEFDRIPLDVISPKAIRIIIDSSISSKNVRSLLATLKQARQSVSTK